ncbi:S41 family peptidase [Patiriisocius hiemis]|uniref:S41 family peptidase n=1 Tax=Patiriisocius hiemis TaxID=3075604 RepID=A0ABU2Y988_9FLAO|nr:S41 family peptidase [Constantimarinum sp. W242]MDT0554751.1 S41 family peptidase [Constantimarinum sp. W242]
MKNFIIALLLTAFNIAFSQDNRVEQPIKNFDKLWNEFNDRYANFEIKNINWNEIYKKYRPLINENTTNDSLFKVCNNMLLELKDGHVNLVQYGKKDRVVNKADDGSPSTFIKNFPLSKEETPNIHQLLKTADKTLKDNGFLTIGVSKKGSMEYAVSKEYGYLRVLSMGNLSLSDYRKHSDNAVEAFKNLKGIIIDVRFNGGGDDKASFEIASRFTDKKRIGHYKREKIKGSSDFKKLKTKYLEPSGEKQFVKPIVVLTSDLTASAAEVFTMIMKELPYVRVVGDNTNGIFSDMYNFKLPNGWLATLSHQQYFSSKMKNFEGIGIEPDIKLLNQPQDINNEIDPLIEKGIAELKKAAANNGYE